MCAANIDDAAQCERGTCVRLAGNTGFKLVSCLQVTTLTQSYYLYIEVFHGFSKFLQADLGILN
jgi:hypothetical protein